MSVASFAAPAPSNSSFCIANLISHWWFGSQRHFNSASMDVKALEIGTLAEAEMQRKQSQQEAYLPDYFLIERLHHFHLAPKQCPENLLCFGVYLAGQLDTGVTRLSAKALRQVESYWIPAAKELELTQGLTAAPPVETPPCCGAHRSRALPVTAARSRAVRPPRAPLVVRPALATPPARPQ